MGHHGRPMMKVARDAILNLPSLLSLLCCYVTVGVLSEVDESSFMNRCSLYIDEKNVNECIHCYVIGSTPELFYDQLNNENYGGDLCQPQIDASYNSVVTIHASDQNPPNYLILSLESHLSNLHHTNEVLFRVGYFSSSLQQSVDHYFAAKIQVANSDRERLPKMRIALPLGDADLHKKVRLLSHSRLTCGGLSSSLEILSNGSADSVTFEPKESKLKDDDKTCKYLQMKRSPNLKQDRPAKMPKLVELKSQMQKAPDQTFAAKLHDKKSSKTANADDSLFIILTLIVLAAVFVITSQIVAVLVQTNRLDRRNWEKIRQCFCCTGNRRPNNAQNQQPNRESLELQPPLIQSQMPQPSDNDNSNQQVLSVIVIYPDARGHESDTFEDILRHTEVENSILLRNQPEQILQDSDYLQ